MARAPEHAKPPEEKAPEAVPIETVADEQRKRSEEIQKMGVEAFKAEHDDRPPEERGGSNRQVPGVIHPKDERTSER